MTADDDAFLRTIVDEPGNDVPRLVYADWLDDRDDPRGPFLRAEVAWAQPWKEWKRPGDASKLRALAANLDPLWVARVARPPVGVCCAHLSLSATGDVCRPEDIDAAGDELGVKLPPQLRALLLNYTLGQLRGGPFVLPRPGRSKSWPVDAFVCLTDPDFDDDRTSYELVDHTIHFREEAELPTRYVFLAGMFDEHVVVSCRTANAGTVYYWDGFETRAKKLADTIADFLAMLVPKTWPLTDNDFSKEQ